jgi:predicted nucleic acid-binding protein
MGTTDQGPPLVVCDAGPLIHLDELDALDLLADFAEVLVPDAVWREVVQHRPAALNNPGVTLRRITPRMEVSPELEALAQVFSLHTGEWEALRVAMEHRPGLLLTDDTAARLAAGNLRIGTHGTIGILVRAIRRRQRTKEEILVVLKSIPNRSTLHLKRSLLEAVISEVEGSA